MKQEIVTTRTKQQKNSLIQQPNKYMIEKEREIKIEKGVDLNHVHRLWQRPYETNGASLEIGRVRAMDSGSPYQRFHSRNRASETKSQGRSGFKALFELRDTCT